MHVRGRGGVDAGGGTELCVGLDGAGRLRRGGAVRVAAGAAGTRRADGAAATGGAAGGRMAAGRGRRAEGAWVDLAAATVTVTVTGTVATTTAGGRDWPGVDCCRSSRFGKVSRLTPTDATTTTAAAMYERRNARSAHVRPMPLIVPRRPGRAGPPLRRTVPASARPERGAPACARRSCKPRP